MRSGSRTALVILAAALAAGCRPRQAGTDASAPEPRGITDEAYARVWIAIHHVAPSDDRERYEFEVQQILDENGMTRQAYEEHGRRILGRRGRLVDIVGLMVEEHPAESVLFARNHGLVGDACIERFRRKNLEYLRAALDGAPDEEVQRADRVRIAKETLIACGVLDGTVGPETGEPVRPEAPTEEQICADPRWAGTLPCREEVPGRIDLFVMSRCPYGIAAEKAVMPVVEHFRGKLELRLHFVVEIVDALGYQLHPRKHLCWAHGDRFVCSLHGPTETEEDLRQACVQDLHPDGHAFMDYVTCRNEDLAADWRSCASPADATAIEACATGARGLELLASDADLAARLDVRSSPTWLLGNDAIVELSSDPAAIRDAVCARWPALSGCKRPLAAQKQAPAKPGGCKM
jgi:hypothetical protein